VNTPLRLLHVVRSLRAETGGVAAAVRHLAAAQAARGDAVTIVSLDPSDRAEPGLVVGGENSAGYGYARPFVPWLRKHRGEFDAVLVHGLWQYHGFGTWRALRGTATPYFVFCHGMLDPWFKRTYPLKHFKKWLYWPWAEYRVLRDARGVLFTTDEERAAARRSFALYRATEQVVPLGVSEPPPPEESHAPATSADERGVRPYLLFLGRVHPKKGLAALLHGYARSCATRSDRPALVIAGPVDDEAYRRTLLQLTERLGLTPRIRWLPHLSGAAKWRVLRGAEAFVLPSHQENFGMAVVEALACGRPVLISHAVNLWREIAADGAGLVAADTPAGVAELLDRWSALDPLARARMAAAARACYERRYTLARAEEALRAVLTGSAPAGSTARPA
jgi:glycosyltransferase involved in cell wall biosynthesis